ncbi:MAG: hypothetical protein HY077_09745 [Elusimicrobia bacterium]|nr:hypothetical protein [Elusimicrobiota bacterium]
MIRFMRILAIISALLAGVLLFDKPPGRHLLNSPLSPSEAQESKEFGKLVDEMIAGAPKGKADLIIDRSWKIGESFNRRLVAEEEKRQRLWRFSLAALVGISIAAAVASWHYGKPLKTELSA